MGIRVYKKTSAGRRFASVLTKEEITKHVPEKSLLRPKRRINGRNCHGVITVRGRGGGAKRQYRVIDFKRRTDNVEARVVGIEYDPNRSSNIALVEYPGGERRYIIAPRGLTDGDSVMSSAQRIDPKVGNCMPLKFIPTGLSVHCIEMTAGRGGQMCRSAGMYARLSNREDKWATLVLPSGEIRQVSVECRATIGEVGNEDHQHVRLGKAGRNRYLGRRPKNRGMAKSHDNHPMGGGEGKSKGNRPPAGPTGTLAKGGPTRKPKALSSKRIIRRRRSVRYGQLTL